MLNIELTLLIQAINFFIAYKMLDYLLVRPAVSLILHNNRDIEILEENIANEKLTLKRFEEENAEKWHKCKDYFDKESPKGIPEIVINLVEGISINPSKKSEKDLDKLTHEISDALIEMVRL